MRARLEIGASLQLPLEAVTQTFALLGKRGVGKTHGAAVFAEELLEHRLQVVVLDPVGVWWGLRSSADGKSAGHAILVLGGEHGDLPLESTAGRLVADFVISKVASVVLDLGEFSKNDQGRFVTDFLERVYQKNRAPLQLIIDEADAFAPQRLHPGAQRCFGAVDTVVRRGRARGIGVTLVTQRSAAINKDVLTQTEVLVAFRTIAPQDRAAIEAWVEVHADEDEAGQVLKTLAVLEVGEAWIWSPAWLKRLSRVRIRRRRTFDSSATPEVGQVLRAPRAVAPVDVEALRGELQQLVQKADQEDPRRLRARILQLERELAAKPKPAAAPGRVQRVEVPTLTSADRRAIETAVTKVGKTEIACEKLALELRKAADRLNAIARPPAAPAPSPAAQPARPPAASVGRQVAPPPARLAHAVAGGNGQAPDLDKAQRSILAVLAQHPDGCSRAKIAILAGYASGGGGFNNALSRLRQTGLLEGANGAVMRITDAGVVAAGGIEPLPVGAALVDYWLRHPSLGAAERAVLQVLIDSNEGMLTKDQIADRAGYAPGGGGFNNALSRLRTMGLLEGRNSEAMRATEHLAGGGL